MVSSFNKNLRSLGIAQAINFLYPLIALPIIGKSIGISSFGTLMSVYVACLALTTVVDFGFNFEGPRLALIAPKDKKAIAELYVSILSIKIIIALSIISLTFLYLLFIEPTRELNPIIVLILIIPTLIGTAISPQWLLLSYGTLSSFVYINAITRILFMAFYLYYDRSSLLIAAISISAPILVTNLIAQKLTKLKYHDIKIVTLTKLVYFTKLAYPSFLSNIASLPYTQGGTILVGFFYGAIPAGLYAAADRLVRPIIAIQGVIFQSAYPDACNSNNIFKTVRTPVLLSYLISTVSLALIIIFSDLLLLKFYSSEYIAATLTFKILSLTLILTPVSMAIAQLFLIAKGYGKITSKAYFITSIAYLIFGPLLVMKYSITGAAFALIISEIFSTCLLFFYSRNLNNE